ncbi:hypothetical protein [Halorussus caseinilyticus]|uniref:Uncharacterized protein n=1 Tax=Halorussus caseinilyticus TaxID=3034025 RepID=A0ABD5WPK9_9EURY|nr:hypothetical protein [Halorussus sp. DT72]
MIRYGPRRVRAVGERLAVLRQHVDVFLPDRDNRPNVGERGQREQCLGVGRKVLVRVGRRDRILAVSRPERGSGLLFGDGNRRDASPSERPEAALLAASMTGTSTASGVSTVTHDSPLSVGRPDSP